MSRGGYVPLDQDEDAPVADGESDPAPESGSTKPDLANSSSASSLKPEGLQKAMSGIFDSMVPLKLACNLTRSN